MPCGSRLDSRDIVTGVFATYWVVADTPEQALDFCRRFEPPDVRASLSVSAAEDLGPATGELLGVARARGGYAFYRGGESA